VVTSAGIYSTLLRLVRFLIVGLFNSLVSYLAFALIIRIGWHYTVATLVAYSVGTLMGFKLHGRFVFDHPGDERFWRFIWISLALLACSLGIQKLAQISVNAYAAGAIAAAITIPVSFLLNRAFVFHAPPTPDQEG
jgi:putative flippase GtrA